MHGFLGGAGSLARTGLYTVFPCSAGIFRENRPAELLLETFRRKNLSDYSALALKFPKYPTGNLMEVIRELVEVFREPSATSRRRCRPSRPVNLPSTRTGPQERSYVLAQSRGRMVRRRFGSTPIRPPDLGQLPRWWTPCGAAVGEATAQAIVLVMFLPLNGRRILY